MTRTSGGIDALRTAMTGTVLVPGDPEYDEARTVWNGDIDRYPAVVARCTGAPDVAAAIAYAESAGLEVAVRGGAHGYWGAAVPEGGMMIDLSLLNGVVVDPDARLARCGGGATLADLDAATQQHGLAVTGGTISHTGVGGLTLGGGMGWLTRKCGLTIDNLVSAEVVLADGRRVRASESQEPDLFWALRGGGGNFGVVTEFEFRLYEVGPVVHLGLFFYDLDRAADALRLGRDVLGGLPRDAGGMLVALNAPPAPFVPQEHHFAPGVAVLVAGFAGEGAHDALIAPVRERLVPLFELVTPIPYTELQKMLDDAAPWGIRNYTKALMLDELTDEAIDVVAGRLPEKVSPMTIVPIFPLGGAYADVGDDDTAFGGSRSARWAFNMDAIAPDAETLAADRVWVRSLWDDMRPFARDSGSYVNFMAEYEEDRVLASYGAAKYARLAAVKAEYDPGNVLHLNANIKPS
ncbi:FAD-linked oxidase [Pseudonocardia sp. CNS-139]|nr:FAD-linked oxidase [Pseudonocardia sp. CNS-139]